MEGGAVLQRQEIQEEQQLWAGGEKDPWNVYGQSPTLCHTSSGASGIRVLLMELIGISL